MVCLDTTFLIDLLRKKPEAEKKLNILIKRSDGPCVTVITVGELFYGAYKSKNVEVEKQKVRSILSGLLMLEMDEHGAEKFGQLLSTLDQTGQKINDRDVLIASIALSKGENVIVTRNAKDFAKIIEVATETY